MFPQVCKNMNKITADQGREYISKQQRNWYKKKWSPLETTIAYTPQQNRVAERYNRTVVEKIQNITN